MRVLALLVVIFSQSLPALAQLQDRRVSGVIVSGKGDAVEGISILARTAHGEGTAVSNDGGQFALNVTDEDVTLQIGGAYTKAQELTLPLNAPSTNLRITVDFLLPPLHQSIVITASALEPQLETQSDDVYKKALFSRDDQLLEALNGGINAGQHEGGGKSLEIRRFGFNLDHGGTNGGLKVLVDDVQQNQGTQGHGQGYLGAL